MGKTKNWWDLDQPDNEDLDDCVGDSDDEDMMNCYECGEEIYWDDAYDDDAGHYICCYCRDEMNRLREEREA